MKGRERDTKREREKGRVNIVASEKKARDAKVEYALGYSKRKRNSDNNITRTCICNVELNNASFNETGSRAEDAQWY